MNVHWKGLVWGIAAGLLACGSPVAAQERTIEKSTEARTTTESRSTNRITTLIKSEVVLREGQAAGQIVDFVVSDQGCIEYLVAEHEEGYYVIPYSAARVDYQEHQVRLTVTERQFQEVTFFKNSDWPDLTDRTVQQRVFKLWGVRSARASSTFDERSTNRPLRPGDRADDADRDPDARQPRTPAREPRSPAPRDPKSPNPREPKSPAPREPDAESGDRSPRPNSDATPRPRPRTEGEPRPKPRSETEPRPRPSSPPAGTPEPKTPRNENP